MRRARTVECVPKSGVDCCRFAASQFDLLASKMRWHEKHELTAREDILARLRALEENAVGHAILIGCLSAVCGVV